MRAAESSALRSRMPTVALALAALATTACRFDSAAGDARTEVVRLATFNLALNRPTAGALADELESGHSAQAAAVAEIIQRVRPDVLLLNELDWDAEGRALDAFCSRYLAVAHGDADAIEYPHRFTAPVNTGEPSGLDLDQDGRSDGPGDAFGYGRFPGQYGMAILSRFPIDVDRVRTFRNYRWRDLPEHELPLDYYSEPQRDVLRLSSKSHWDVPVELGADRVVHVLASHPTPPVFDGPEDRNGRRNRDEIRFWSRYLDDDDRLVDDAGHAGGLPPDASFVIVGDLNADPNDGDSRTAIRELIAHARVAGEVVPTSDGAAERAAAQGGANTTHRGDAHADTGDFSDHGNGPGNLRIDYVLPSRDFDVRGSGVFWPPATEATFTRLIGTGDPVVSSDHRLVWVDVAR